MILMRFVISQTLGNIAIFIDTDTNFFDCPIWMNLMEHYRLGRRTSMLRLSTCCWGMMTIMTIMTGCGIPNAICSKSRMAISLLMRLVLLNMSLSPA